MAPAPADYCPKPTVANLMSESEESSRQRRHRRIEMRRMRSGSSGSGQAQQLSPDAEAPHSESVNKNDAMVPWSERVNEDVLPELPNMVDFSAKNNAMPTYGVMSIQGVSESMEDTWSVTQDLCCPDVIGGQPLHCFAVYDGHGGPHISSLCKQMMHLIIAKELVDVGSKGEYAANGNSQFGASSSSKQNEQEFADTQWENLMRASLIRSFRRIDHMALSMSMMGRNAYNCGCYPLQLAFAGSTANVALLTPNHILVANCGDSRSVLYRNGKAITLSIDQKPDRLDEQERIFAASGQLVYQNGELRVQGVLNMSRSIGDPMLKSFIISQPEISITKRESGDECLILASDGLWDVMSNDLAGEVAKRTLCNEGLDATPSCSFSGQSSMNEKINDPYFSSRCDLAAALLCRLALARGSPDNITVIVVGLKR